MDNTDHREQKRLIFLILCLNKTASRTPLFIFTGQSFVNVSTVRWCQQKHANWKSPTAYPLSGVVSIAESALSGHHHNVSLFIPLAWYTIQHSCGSVIMCYNITSNCLNRKSTHNSKLVDDKRGRYRYVIAEIILCMYEPSQWETTLHCNVVSHWLGAYMKIIPALYIRRHAKSVKLFRRRQR